MTDAEINRRLAKALGWEWWGWALGIPNALTSGPHAGKSFSPATDSNHLREYVLPEVERRGLTKEFGLEVSYVIVKFGASWWDDWMRLLTAEPRDMALAALKVLEEPT